MTLIYFVTITIWSLTQLANPEAKLCYSHLNITLLSKFAKGFHPQTDKPSQRSSILFLRYTLILSFHLRLDLPSWLFHISIGISQLCFINNVNIRDNLHSLVCATVPFSLKHAKCFCHYTATKIRCRTCVWFCCSFTWTAWRRWPDTVAETCRRRNETEVRENYCAEYVRGVTDK